MEWKELTQLIVDWVENDKTASLTLLEVSERLGYSPHYCSRKFRQVTGKTIREYTAMRRMNRVALELRDSDRRIIDIAFEYGFSSHEALTRAFVSAFGLSPSEYREARPAIELLTPDKVDHHKEPTRVMRRQHMSTKSGIETTIEHIDSHFFIGFRDPQAEGYWQLWDKRDCDQVMGSLESIIDSYLPGVPKLQLGGWYSEGDRRGYLYGIMVPADYDGVVPKGLEKISVPGGEYACFHHAAYDYSNQEQQVGDQLRKAMTDFQPSDRGYRWTADSRPTWQRHLPEEYGQAILRPMVKA